MKKRLLFICQYFYPETFRGNDIAFDFAARGVDVTVICGIPNYPKGKFHDGYGLFKKRVETVNGVKVIRIPIIPRGQGNKLQLIANYFSYFTIASLFIPFHLIRNRHYDACFVQQLSPVMMSVPGVVFKKLTGKKLYTWVLDLWPESLKAAGGITNKRILKFFERFAKLQYSNSDKILVSSKGFSENICSKGDYSNKIQHMPNWADDALNSAADANIPSLPDGFKVVFTGNVGEAQDFDSIVEAAKLLTPEDKIRFIIVGDGRKKEWIDEQIKKYNLHDRIILLGRFDIRCMPTFYANSNCLLLPLKDNEILNLTVPAKLQAYMSAGKPVVAMINGDANELVNDVKCGIAVPASSPDRLVAALRQLKNCSESQLREMGDKGRKYCLEHFDKEKIINNLYDLMFGA